MALQPNHKKSKDDKFFFQFFRISTEHVNKINGFLLDNAYHCTSILFRSENIFLKTLEYYMTEPMVIYKNVIGDGDRDRRLTYLKNLAELMKGLGSDAKPVWKELPPDLGTLVLSEFDKMRLMNQCIDEWLESVRILKGDLFTNKDESKIPGGMELYTTLGGSKDTLLDDLEQTRRMLQLRIKLDVWSQGSPEWMRNRNRELLTDAYLRLPSARVWLYAKRLRIMILYHDSDADLRRELDGQVFNPNLPEDIIAGGACHLASHDKLNHLMYNTTMNSIEKMKNPTFDPWAFVAFAFDRTAMGNLMQARKFVTRTGNLKECGVQDIEKMAKEAENSAIERQLHRQQGVVNRLYDDEEKLEIAVRVIVRSKLKETISHNSAPTSTISSIKRMEKVWFEFTYPAPP